MIFPIPDPTFWQSIPMFENLPSIPISGWRRWAWQVIAKQEYYQVQPAWVGQWQRYIEHQMEQAEAYQVWLDQQDAWQIMMEEMAMQGEYWADRLPVYLHHLGLSYRRTVRERKEDRPYEKVDYCEIEHWYFDEYAYYFWIQTWPLPYGVKISQFQPNTEDSEIGQSLSGSLGTFVTIEFNQRGHERQGLWIIAEHTTGRGKVPLHLSYQKCLAHMPKGSKPLAFPVGHGTHNRAYIVDLAEVYNLLVGGSVGGGKSNILNVMIATFISRNSPTDLRLFLCDFKRVEFSFYRGLPHLGGDVPYLQNTTVDKDGKEKKGQIRTVKADYEAKEGQDIKPPLGTKPLTEAGQLVQILNYALAEIERRTNLLAGRYKKVDTFNKRNPHRKLSRWIIVIDELADVMLQPRLKKQVEPVLIRIAQLGRALGIHLILATQTPKNEIVTLLIQNNIINRIVFRCGTGQASGVMLDGKYEAARLIPNPGRCIFREGDTMIEIQTPEITDLTVRSAVRAAKDGQQQNVVDTSQLTIPPETLFGYALAELDGFCSIRDLYGHFKKDGVSRQEIVDTLKNYEVRGTPPALEPEIDLEDEQYYLVPGVSNTPRQLIGVNNFLAQFDDKWADHPAFRVLRPVKSGQTGEGDTLENEKILEVTQP